MKKFKFLLLAFTLFLLAGCLKDNNLGDNHDEDDTEDIDHLFPPDEGYVRFIAEDIDGSLIVDKWISNVGFENFQNAVDAVLDITYMLYAQHQIVAIEGVSRNPVCSYWLRSVNGVTSMDPSSQYFLRDMIVWTGDVVRFWLSGVCPTTPPTSGDSTARDENYFTFNRYNEINNGTSVILKGELNSLSNYNGAWGTEVQITDNYGNNSKYILENNIYGLFTLPMESNVAKNFFGKSYVFNLVKDSYMGGRSQFGFAGSKKACFNGNNWTCSFTYGIDFYDDIVEGTLNSVTYSETNGYTLVVGTTTIKINSNDNNQFEYLRSLRTKKVYLPVINDGTSVNSLLKGNKVQISEEFGKWYV